MTTLVIAEHDGAALKVATLNTVAAAAKLGGEVHVLVAGGGCAAVAQAAAAAGAVAKVLLADAPHLAAQSCTPRRPRIWPRWWPTS
jgi:electron transfer flavoprotein alpha subunit